MRSARCFLLLFTVGALLFGCQRSYKRVDSEVDLNQNRLGNSLSINDSLVRIFVQFRSSGSIIVRGNCTDARFINDEVSHGPTEKFSSVRDALAAWSNIVPRLRIHQDPNGMWRVSDNTASTELLRVEINDLHARVFNGAEAVGAVMGSKEVQRFFRNNEVGQASTRVGLAPDDGSALPRSDWHVHGVTVADALDHAITMYPGVWVYTECVTDHRKLVAVRTASF